MESFISFIKSISPENEPWNKIIAKLWLVIIASFLLLILPVLIALIFPLFKEKLSKKATTYLYAFMSGFFLTMALFGFLRESLEISSLSAQGKGYSTNKVYLWNILLIGLGIISGIGLALGIKFFIEKVINKKLKNNFLLHSHNYEHSEDEAHSHETIEEKPKNYSKLVALILLLTHRIPEGFLIGVSLNAIYNGSTSNMNLAFLISFILHLIPEELVFYYRQREMGFSKKKSIGISIGLLFLFLPAIFLGIYSGEAINNLWQLAAFIEAFIAGIFIFTSIFEFLPEFAFEKYELKIKYSILIFVVLGIALSAIILSIHSHGNGTLFGNLGVTFKFK
ncbi:MAG: ZIP family metal transporter [Metamycoplasmataceae bacterium]